MKLTIPLVAASSGLSEAWKICQIGTTVLNPDIKLSVYVNGRLVKEPVLLTIVGLRETPLVASDYDEAKVNRICSTLQTNGVCFMSGDDDRPVYIIEKCLQPKIPRV